jgi:hypothetical protein
MRYGDIKMSRMGDYIIMFRLSKEKTAEKKDEKRKSKITSFSQDYLL